MILIARSQTGMTVFFRDDVAEAFGQLRKSEEFEFRVLEFYCRFSVLSYNHFVLARDYLWIDAILDVADQTDDVLGLMNILQLIEILCESTDVLDYLVENDIALLFEEMLDSNYETIEIKAIETLGNICEKCKDHAFLAFQKTNLVDYLFKIF